MLNYNNLDNNIYKIQDIMIKCGKKMLNSYNMDKKIKHKDGIENLVTKYDIMIQKNIKKELIEIYPNSTFIGEEDLIRPKLNEKGYTIIVDPIDGTTNFSRDIGLSAISIGILKDKEPYIGLCYNPYLDEMFIAEKGKGAYLNRKKITVSNKKLSEGILLSGSSPYYADLRKKSLEFLNILGKEASDYRRLGSAVIEMCYIACGRAELYFELKLQPWDYCAASLIVTEAGGNVTDIFGNSLQYLKSTSIVASNNKEDYLNKIKI